MKVGPYQYPYSQKHQIELMLQQVLDKYNLIKIFLFHLLSC